MSIWHKNERRPISYYEILNVLPDSNDGEIHTAYKKLAMKFHPDRNPRNRMMAEHRFRLITEAYQRVKTRESRAVYNANLRRQIKNLKASNSNINPDKKSWISALSSLFISRQDKGTV